MEKNKELRVFAEEIRVETIKELAIWDLAM